MRRRSIIAFCLTCEWRRRYLSTQLTICEGCLVVVPYLETDPFTSLTATYASRVHEYGFALTTRRQQQVILSLIGVPAAFLAGWAVELQYIGRKGSLAISSGESPSHLTQFHHSTTSREIKGSLACFSTRAPPPGRRTSFWVGTVVTCVAATYVLDRTMSCSAFDEMTWAYTDGDVDDVRRALCRLSRDISCQGPWHRQRSDSHRGPRVWRDGTCLCLPTNSGLNDWGTNAPHRRPSLRYTRILRRRYRCTLRVA